jgi:hypothetical protein
MVLGEGAGACRERLVVVLDSEERFVFCYRGWGIESLDNILLLYVN